MSKRQKYGIWAVLIGLAALVLILPLGITSMEFLYLFSHGRIIHIVMDGVAHSFMSLFVLIAALVGIGLIIWGIIWVVNPRCIHKLNVFAIIIPMIIVSQLMAMGGLMGIIYGATHEGDFVSVEVVAILYLVFGIIGILGTIVLIKRMEDLRYIKRSDT